MKQFVVLLILLFVSVLSFAQHISGKVLDENKEPLAYADVVAYSLPDSLMIEGAITDNDGVFFLNKITDNNVIVSISMVGYKTVLFTEIHSDLGTIEMEPESFLLEGVIVKADLPKYRTVNGGFVTQVDNTLLSKAGKAKDVLTRLPRVSEKDGEYVVFGKGKPEIYINGRKLKNNDELLRLESKDIKSVEVLTNPGAQYGASVQSVIRIKTIHNIGDGLSATLTGTATQQRKGWFSDLAQLNYRFGNWDVFGELNHQNYYFHQSQNNVFILHGNKHFIMSDGSFDDGEGRMQQLAGQLGFNYTLDDDRSFGLKYDVKKEFPDIYNGGTLRMDVTQDGIFAGSIVNLMNWSGETAPVHELNGYWRNKFGKLSADLNVSYFWRKEVRKTFNEEFSSYWGNRLVNSVNNSRNQLWAGKAILSFPFNDRFTLFGGSELTSSYSKQRFNNEQSIITDSDDKVIENNLAFFMEGNWRFGKFNLGAGLRYEHVVSDYFEAGIKSENESRVYDQWFPNLSLSYSNGKFQSQLSYSSKVNRPSYYQLSNYVQYDNQFTYEGGNPLLQPSVSYNVELNVMYGWLQFSSLYQYRKRAILDVGQLYDNESDILLFSPINVKCNKLMVITLSASPVIGFWHPTFEFLLQKQFFDAKRYGVNEPLGKPAVGLNFRNQVAFPHDWILSLDAFYTSTFNYGFSRIYETKNLNIGVTKELFDKKLYLKVAVDDIFYSSREKVDQFYQIAFSSLCRKSDSRRLTLTVTYRFNSTGSKYRGTGAGMSEKQRM